MTQAPKYARLTVSLINDFIRFKHAMKRSFLTQSLICLLALSCSVRELDTMDGIADGKVYFATLESYAQPDTKVYVDEDIKIRWDADDRISLFEQSTMNRQYRYTGETGSVDGNFVLVTDPFGTGGDLDYLCAVYPYLISTKIKNNDLLYLTLPEKQTYRKESFGPGANTMVSVTKDNPLKFKNVGGYLVLKFYGEGIAVSSIRLEGKNGEKLSGDATMKPEIGVLPKISMAESAGTSITLTCDEPIKLGAGKENATIFWMVVPPTSFSKGFKLTVTDPDGKVFVKETEKELSIVRNTVLRIAPVELKLN